MNECARRVRARDETHRPTVRTRASPLVVVSSITRVVVVSPARVDVSRAPRSVARSVGRAVGRTVAETVEARA